MQTRRLAASFVGLNSSLGQSPGELRSCKVVQKCGFSKYEYLVHQCQRCQDGSRTTVSGEKFIER